MKKIKFTVMDLTGDTMTKHKVDTKAEIAEAETKFKEIMGVGFTAAKVTGPGTQEIITDFDPTAEETIFYPPLQGG